MSRLDACQFRDYSCNVGTDSVAGLAAADPKVEHQKAAPLSVISEL